MANQLAKFANKSNEHSPRRDCGILCRVLPDISNDQRQAIEEANGSPVYVVDRVNLNKYVLVDADHFEHFVSMLIERDADVIDLLA